MISDSDMLDGINAVLCKDFYGVSGVCQPTKRRL